ncbi:MAG: hypothetical protein KAH32_07500 [Chlamydiia bacterium]|nr:hypothetical protein [Chlamydiia bacterium]
MKFNNNLIAIGGFTVQDGSPIDDRLQYTNIEAFALMLEHPTDYRRLHDGMVVSFETSVSGDINDATTYYIWKESSVGLLPSGFTYPDGYQVFAGINYNSKTYNLLLFDSTSHVTVVVADIENIVSIPIERIPYLALLNNLVTVYIKEEEDYEITLPDSYNINYLTGMLDIYVVPSYTAGTTLNIKII